MSMTRSMGKVMQTPDMIVQDATSLISRASVNATPRFDWNWSVASLVAKLNSLFFAFYNQCTIKVCVSERVAERNKRGILTNEGSLKCPPGKSMIF